MTQWQKLDRKRGRNNAAFCQGLYEFFCQEEVMMNINLHIERLILDGLPIESRQGGFVKQAVEAELTRLLEANGLSARVQTGGAMPSLRAEAIGLTADARPAQIGQQIAQSVYGGINK